MNMNWKLCPGNRRLPSKTTGKQKNPYLSRYGERWVEKLKLSYSMSKFCCVTDLIRFIMNKAGKLIKGCVHEDDLSIFHDSLVLMKLKNTITWMKENNYFHHWLLPMNGLQDGTSIPLDNSLNRDILHGLRFNCFLIRFVLNGEVIDEEERNMCFSFSTPK